MYYQEKYSRKRMIGRRRYPLGDWWLGPWPAPYDAVPAIDLSAFSTFIVYQPKPAPSSVYPNALAVDLASSVINIADPGTNDGTTPVNPGWTAADGWIANGVGYVDTTVAPASQDETLLVAHTGITAIPEPAAFGCTGTGQTSVSFLGGMTTLCGNYSAQGAHMACSTSAVTGVSGNSLFVDGVDVYTIGAASGPIVRTLFLLALNGVTSPDKLVATGSESAFFWSRPAVSDEQVAAISWAMEQIRSA